MNLKSKKCVSALIAVLLLVIVIVMFMFVYQNWIVKYSDNLNNRIEKDTKFVPVVENVKGKALYFRNIGDDNLVIESTYIGGIDCSSSGTFPPGVNKLDISACYNAIDTGKHELLIYTPEGVHGSYIFYEHISEIINDPFAIGGSNGCDKLQGMGDNLSGNYYLIEDIYCFDTALWNGGKGFIPIGGVPNPFTGSLDGHNYTIYGLYIDDEDKETGLFARLDGANITNLRMDLIYILGNKKSAGAIAGYATDTLISNVHVKGDINGEKKSTGAIIGHLESSTLELSSYSNGTVTGQDKSVGGIIGFAKTSVIRNSFSTGTIEGDKLYAGGLIGEVDSSTIINSFSTGVVTSAHGTAGGLIGDSQGSSISNSYWDEDSSGESFSDGGTGRTTIQMMQNSTFVSWNFTHIWNITEGLTYPSLR